MIYTYTGKYIYIDGVQNLLVENATPTEMAALVAQYQASADAPHVPPPQPTPPLSTLAQNQLDIVTGSRGQIIRCVTAGVTVPATWTAYILALRAIVNGTDKTSTTLPTQPAFVAGT